MKIESIIYLPQDKKKSVKISALWLEKNSIWSGKSQELLLLNEVGHPVVLVIALNRELEMGEIIANIFWSNNYGPYNVREIRSSQ